MFWNKKEKKEKKLVACKNCKFFEYEYMAMRFNGVSYNHHCLYSKKFDPVKGEYVTDPWPCESEERNGYGNCPYFCEKESENE